jgi:hypothetical protein
MTIIIVGTSVTGPSRMIVQIYVLLEKDEEVRAPGLKEGVAE